MESHNNLEKNIFNELVYLQCQNGSLTELAVYREGRLLDKELLSYLESLRDKNYIKYTTPSSESKGFYVVPPKESKNNILFPHIVVNEDALEGQDYIEFLETARDILTTIIKPNTTPLGIETPAHQPNYENLCKEKFRIKRLLEDIKP